MNKEKAVEKRRLRRRYHVRRKLRGTSDQPRLCVIRTHKHITCQLIDDLAGTTLASASTQDNELASKIKYGGNKDAAKVVGSAIAEKAKVLGIGQAKFDRGHCKYHGRVAVVADMVREAGLSL